MIAILHNIRSNHNVGSIFRTADAAGIEKIYLCGITPTPIDRFNRENTALTKVALRGHKYVDWEHTKSITKLLHTLKKDKYTIFAIEQSKKSKSIYNIKLTKTKAKKTALIVGNEVKGLSASILKRSDEIIEIPMHGKKESLNVSVAFGIVIFQLIK
ncbi:MAG: TrmH family RNA methyltransferase [Patescibacteria group bacterium]|jgi:tRNA G18 (ribose-2'-O)-methylase SpoU|nr:TrmH family RNA methyltransferase [Patescibacteria group bacterium]|tara:strand:- start:576 stop:1046 length:471 start_codon:yes stop_codon:yes gene_type:complete